jgi:hypothetical protein
MGRDITFYSSELKTSWEVFKKYKFFENILRCFKLRTKLVT